MQNASNMPLSLEYTIFICTINFVLCTNLYSLLNKSSTCITLIELQTLKKNMKIHTNPDSNYHNQYLYDIKYFYRHIRNTEMSSKKGKSYGFRYFFNTDVITHV